MSSSAASGIQHFLALEEILAYGGYVIKEVFLVLGEDIVELVPLEPEALGGPFF